MEQQTPSESPLDAWDLNAIPKFVTINPEPVCLSTSLHPALADAKMPDLLVVGTSWDTWRYGVSFSLLQNQPHTPPGHDDERRANLNFTSTRAENEINHGRLFDTTSKSITLSINHLGRRWLFWTVDDSPGRNSHDESPHRRVQRWRPLLDPPQS